MADVVRVAVGHGTENLAHDLCCISLRDVPFVYDVMEQFTSVANPRHELLSQVLTPVLGRCCHPTHKFHKV